MLYILFNSNKNFQTFFNNEFNDIFNDKYDEFCDDCCICLEPKITKDKKIFILETCEHTLHEKCMDKRIKDCPLCTITINKVRPLFNEYINDHNIHLDF